MCFTSNQNFSRCAIACSRGPITTAKRSEGMERLFTTRMAVRFQKRPRPIAPPTAKTLTRVAPVGRHRRGGERGLTRPPRFPPPTRMASPGHAFRHLAAPLKNSPKFSLSHTLSFFFFVFFVYLSFFYYYFILIYNVIIYIFATRGELFFSIFFRFIVNLLRAVSLFHTFFLFTVYIWDFHCVIALVDNAGV